MDITFLSGQNLNQVTDTQKCEFKRIRISLLAVLFLVLSSQLVYSQISTGGVLGDFGINATLYPGVNFGGTPPPAGTVDWFKLSTGRNVITQDASTVSTIQAMLQNETNPAYEVRMDGGLGSKADVSSDGKSYKLLIDAVWARDMFGGSGGLDNTAFVVSSKNAADPAIWYPGIGNVLGKNDLIDVAAHMFRDVTPTSDNLIFTGIINRAEPGGSAYMDFEFFIQNVGVNLTTYKFNTGGPDMGHTSFRFAADGSLTQLGDMIYNVSLSNGGANTNVEVRVWVSRANYDAYRNSPPTNMPFSFGTLFDGAGTNAPYGYASIVPKITSDIVGYVNLAGQNPATPPWGSRNTKMNVLTTSYLDYAVTEVGLNLTGLGLDNKLIPSVDPCSFPWKTLMIKTRSSESFTSSLKDFAGPYAWGQPGLAVKSSNSVISCDNTPVTLIATPNRADATYKWTTADGHIVGSDTGTSAIVDKAGTYLCSMTISTGCVYASNSYIVTNDASKLLFDGEPAITYTIPCNGNDGTITAVVSGGSSPYTYTLFNSSNVQVAQATTVASTTHKFTGISAGTYYVSVKGAYACTTTSANFTVPAKVLTYSASVTDVACYGEKTGSISLGTVTGNGTLSYLWNTGNTSKDLVNVGAGNYTVTITDTGGCTSTLPFTINQPTAALAGTISKTDDPGNAGNGSATVTASGGTPAYTYAWRKSPSSDIIGTAATLANIGYGQYSVTITDAKSCSTVKSVFIYEKEKCFDGIDNDGNGLTDCDDLAGCKPATPVLSGPLTPCVGDIATYQAGSTAGTFEWVLPGNIEDVTYPNSYSVSFKWKSKVPGQVCVRVLNPDPTSGSSLKCLGDQVCVSVSPGDDPQAPSAIKIQ